MKLVLFLAILLSGSAEAYVCEDSNWSVIVGPGYSKFPGVDTQIQIYGVHGLVKNILAQKLPTRIGAHYIVISQKPSQGPQVLKIEDVELYQPQSKTYDRKFYIQTHSLDTGHSTVIVHCHAGL